MQPLTLSALVEPTTKQYKPFIEELHNRVKDSAAAEELTLAVVNKVASVAAGSSCKPEIVLVGILLSMRNTIEGFVDGDIALACRQLPGHGAAVDKFIQFLEAEGESGASEEEEDGTE